MGTSLDMCCVVCTEKSLICFSSKNSYNSKEKEINTSNLSIRDHFVKRNSKGRNEQGTNILSKQLNSKASTDIHNEKDTIPKPLTPILLSSKVGLYNQGNSCFMNSILQILIHCYPFINEFEKQTITKNHIISSAFRDLLIQIGTCNGIRYFPKSFIKTFSEVNRAFREVKQQDCQDFLNTLLENINIELNEIKGTLPYQEINQTGDKRMLYKEYLLYYYKREKSIITDVFYWNDLSIRKCNCGLETFFFSRKTDLPLTLLKSNIKPHVTKLIKEKYTQVLNEESPVVCSQCNRKQNCELINSVCCLPPVLILSLQRNNGEDNQKNKIGVEFESEMNLHDIIDKETFDSECETKYVLYALVLHVGKIERGHYITNIKTMSQWVIFDDDKIETIPTDNQNNEYKSSDVYCLFYLRNDCISPIE